MNNVGNSQGLLDLEAINWNGGDLHWTGPHKSFCEVCGGGKEELFGCQTCGMSCHAACMSPAQPSAKLPELWFCPHCTDNLFNVPPVAFDPSRTTTGPEAHASNSSFPVHKVPSKSVGDFEEVHRNFDGGIRGYPTPPLLLGLSTESGTVSEFASGIVQASSAEAHSTTAPESHEQFVDVVHESTKKRGRPPVSTAPLKKKSKYSAYSSEVDKALSVIHSELEMAAKVKRSEDQLHERIKSLEQQLKLQDGQLALVKREAELAKRALEVEKFKLGRLSGQSKGKNDEVSRLREELAQKDEELSSWKAKLKDLVG